MSAVVTGEAVVGAGSGEHAVTAGRPWWVRRLEIALVLLVLPLALALAVAQVADVSTAAAGRRPDVGGDVVLIVDGGGGPVAVERVVTRLRDAGVAARVAAAAGRPTGTTEIRGGGASDTTAARVQRVLRMGTFTASGELEHGTGVTVVVGKDVLEH